MNLSKSLLSRMEKIGDIKIHQQDLTLGVKSGTLYHVQPSFSYRMLDDTTILADGTPDYKTSDAMPFKYSDILFCSQISIIFQYICNHISYGS